jgi:hypothetical protein
MRWTRQRRARKCGAGRVARSVSPKAACRRTMLNPPVLEVSADGYQARRKLWRGWLRTAKPCGSGARCWRQAGGGEVGPTGSGNPFNPPATVTRRIRRREERGISRKTIACGNAGCAGCTGATVVTTVCLLPSAHGPRVLRAPGIPRALTFEGRAAPSLLRVAPRSRFLRVAPRSRFLRVAMRPPKGGSSAKPRASRAARARRCISGKRIPSEDDGYKSSQMHMNH